MPSVIVAETGHLIDVRLAEPNLLFVWHTTDSETGEAWWSVYRSVWLRDGDAILSRAAELTQGHEVTRWEAVADADMMFGNAVLEIHHVV